MIHRIKTKGKKQSIDVWLNANNKKLITIGFDPKHNHTEYFFRQMFVDGTEKFTFNLPQSPKFLDLLIFEINEGHVANSKLFQVERININKLVTEPLFLDDFTKEFIDFASIFAAKSGYLKTGTYFSKKKRFTIKLVEKIMSNGVEVKTPSRIHKSLNYIEVSQAYFNDMTIPSRMNILLHEFSHNYMNENADSEHEADSNGLDLYLDIGYPRIESVYSLTKIFKDINSHVSRLENMDKKLKAHG